MPERYAITIQNLGSYLQWLVSQDEILAKAKGERGLIDSLKLLKDDLVEIEFEEAWVYKEIDQWEKRLSRYKKDQKISQTTADALSFDAHNWYRELLDYLSKCYYWEIRPDGISDLKKLYEDDTASFFDKKKYWNNLSKVARYDLNEACLCLAFEQPTAAAFLITRATEDVLRRLYSAKIQKSFKGFLDWGLITKQLKGKVDTELIESLDYLRNNFRNPVAHPEKVYEQKESERLFHTAINVIQKIIDAMT